MRVFMFSYVKANRGYECSIKFARLADHNLYKGISRDTAEPLEFVEHVALAITTLLPLTGSVGA